jgi:hypothetical protein
MLQTVNNIVSGNVAVKCTKSNPNVVEIDEIHEKITMKSNTIPEMHI